MRVFFPPNVQVSVVLGVRSLYGRRTAHRKRSETYYTDESIPMTKKVACGEFVKRQTADSGYSHYTGSWADLEDMVEFHMTYNPNAITPGYRDGVVLLGLPASGFRCGIVALDEKSRLTAAYAPRREGEAPFIRVSSKAKKQVAKHASVVLYRADVLEENNERETGAEWEIVCIKARVSDEEEPMHYYTMARNFLHLEGGTKGNFSADDFAKSIVYWNSHCMTTKQRGVKMFINRLLSLFS